MLSSISTGLFIALAVLLLILATILTVDERSPSFRTYPCVLRNGGTTQVKVIYSSLLARLIQRATRDVWAVTLWNRVYVAGDHLVNHAVLHELEHVRQWHNYGPLGFVARYLSYHIRRGYLRNPFEREARYAAGQLLSGLPR